MIMCIRLVCGGKTDLKNRNSCEPLGFASGGGATRGGHGRDGIGSGNNMSQPPRSCRRVSFFFFFFFVPFGGLRVCISTRIKIKVRLRAINKNVYIGTYVKPVFEPIYKQTRTPREHQPPRGDGSGGDDDEWRTCSFGLVVAVAELYIESASDGDRAEYNILYCCRFRPQMLHIAATLAPPFSSCALETHYRFIYIYIYT